MLFNRLSLRYLLILMFATVVAIPMVLIAAFAMPSFIASVRQQGEATLETHAAVAREQLGSRQRARVAAMQSLERVTFASAESRVGTVLADQLSQQGKVLGYDSLLWLDAKGVVTGSSTGGGYGHTLDWPVLSKMTNSTDATAFVAILPPTEAVSLGLESGYQIPPRQSSSGKTSAQELAGALSIVSLAPIKDSRGKQIGTIVGLDILKRNATFTDQVVGNVGGQAAVYQNGAVVAQTRQGRSSELGAPMPDAVRAAVLGAKSPFQGKESTGGQTDIVGYSPLVDPSGTVVGALFVGVSDAAFANATNRFVLLFVLVLAAGLTVALTLGWFAARALERPLSRISRAARHIADGDLAVVVPEEGYREAVDMGRAFNTMTEQLREIISRVQLSSSKLDDVSGEIAAASKSSAETASSQASSVAEASATMEEITRSFGAVADGAHRVMEIAEDSLEAAQQGRGNVASSAMSIDMLASGTVAVGLAAEHLADVARDIDQVTYYIGSIAEQTKILALNAAIEAARAGEAGRGFSVVSTEIRKLADSVSDSVNRIATLVHGIQDASQSLAMTANQQAEVASNTVASGAQTSKSFDDILTQMERTASAASEIAAAAAQQQAASRQIVEVMVEVSSGVSGAAASSRQLAESADDVRREAQELHRGMGHFKN